MGHPFDFSVLQIRYAGCKGTLSVDPRLDNEHYQMRLRDSMNKFTSDHDILEICKLSAARTYTRNQLSGGKTCSSRNVWMFSSGALYLNRQDIVLLESRDIPHTNFLLLQNKHHLQLIRSLLTPAIAYELLQEKVLPGFQLNQIARHVNLVEEQFFAKLIITCAFNIVQELIDHTRIHISPEYARNMFGIVDEYGLLEYGQIFVQYTSTRDKKLPPQKSPLTIDWVDEDDEADRQKKKSIVTLLKGKVVVTKNPCHHPGDLRIFEAVYHKELAHLKDVIVFPQKGHRPHSNEISGSDLDGSYSSNAFRTSSRVIHSRRWIRGDLVRRSDSHHTERRALRVRFPRRSA